MKIYIAGPMTGYKDYNYPAFMEAEERIGNFTHGNCEIFNPARNPEQKTYADYLREAIKLLIQCDTIYMLPGWEKSNGATLEHKIAVTLGMEVIYE
jgi:hypothetical protein